MPVHFSVVGIRLPGGGFDRIGGGGGVYPPFAGKYGCHNLGGNPLGPILGGQAVGAVLLGIQSRRGVFLAARRVQAEAVADRRFQELAQVHQL